MFKDKTGHEWRISITTPAGRERYLSIFKKYIYREMDKGLVDEWQLWQNTVKESDIAYLQSMVAENPKVKIYTIEDLKERYNFCDTLRSYEFFKNCHDDNTIYIRFDDDIVWYEDGAIEKIINARLDHPEAFAIYPNVINSTFITSEHQRIGALGKEAGVVNQKNPTDPNWNYLDAFSYTDSGFIDFIHNTFKRRYEEGTLRAYYLPSRMLDDYQRFSICSLAWFGKDKITPSQEEEPQMSWQLPEATKRPVYLCGDALMVHYSYHTQRDYLESCVPEKLEFYKELANNDRV